MVAAFGLLPGKGSGIGQGLGGGMCRNRSTDCAIRDAERMLFSPPRLTSMTRSTAHPVWVLQPPYDGLPAAAGRGGGAPGAVQLMEIRTDPTARLLLPEAVRQARLRLPAAPVVVRMADQSPVSFAMAVAATALAHGASSRLARSTAFPRFCAPRSRTTCTWRATWSSGWRCAARPYRTRSSAGSPDSCAGRPDILAWRRTSRLRSSRAAPLGRASRGTAFLRRRAGTGSAGRSGRRSRSSVSPSGASWRSPGISATRTSPR